MNGLDDALCDLLAAALGELAAGCLTPGEVAGKLHQAGCRGERDNTCGCPVAVWVTRRVRIPLGQALIVGSDNVEIVAAAEGVMTQAGMGDVLATATVPRVVAQFIGEFDHTGRWPYLEGEPVPADGEHFEVYPCGAGIGAYDTRPFGRLQLDQAMAAACEASVPGRLHAVERVTVRDGLTRRNCIAEYRDGKPVPLTQPQ